MSDYLIFIIGEILVFLMGFSLGSIYGIEKLSKIVKGISKEYSNEKEQK